jgi:hypothetical protein
MTYDWVCNWSNTTGETWVHSRFLVGFDRVARSLEFCLLLCRSLLVFSFLSLFIWPLCCLPFDLLAESCHLLVKSSPLQTVWRWPLFTACPRTSCVMHSLHIRRVWRYQRGNQNL